MLRNEHISISNKHMEDATTRDCVWLARTSNLASMSMSLDLLIRAFLLEPSISFFF